MKSPVRMAALMRSYPIRCIETLLFISLLVYGTPAQSQSEVGELSVFSKSDRVVFIGNGFAEAQQDYPYFETLLSTRLPEHELSFRNLARSGDEVALRPRPLNFGDLHTHLRKAKADVIIACFGMNESFKGPGHLDTFKQNLAGFVDTLRTTSYNGSAPPKVVLVSPIAHETIEPMSPNPAAHNRSLALHTEAMRTYAARHETVTFVNLYQPTKKIMDNPSAENLTSDGIQLSRYGHWVVSQLMGQALGLSLHLPRIVLNAAGEKAQNDRVPVQSVVALGRDLTFRVVKVPRSLPPPPGGKSPPPSLEPQEPVVEIDSLKPGTYLLRVNGEVIAKADAKTWSEGLSVNLQGAELESLQETVTHKNQLWFYRYRAVNGEYIYGRRRHQPVGIKNFRGEFGRLDQMIRSEEYEIWQLVRGLLHQSWRLEMTDRRREPVLP